MWIILIYIPQYLSPIISVREGSNFVLQEGAGWEKENEDEREIIKKFKRKGPEALVMNYYI